MISQMGKSFKTFSTALILDNILDKISQQAEKCCQQCYTIASYQHTILAKFPTVHIVQNSKVKYLEKNG